MEGTLVSSHLASNTDLSDQCLIEGKVRTTLPYCASPLCYKWYPPKLSYVGGKKCSCKVKGECWGHLSLKCFNWSRKNTCRSCIRIMQWTTNAIKIQGIQLLNKWKGVPETLLACGNIWFGSKRALQSSGGYGFSRFVVAWVWSAWTFNNTFRAIRSMFTEKAKSLLNLKMNWTLRVQAASLIHIMHWAWIPIKEFKQTTNSFSRLVGFVDQCLLIVQKRRGEGPLFL